jgi:hypothetical protein
MTFVNPENGYSETAHCPWLWCLLFGPLYLLAKGCYGWAIIAFIAAVSTAGFSHLVMPFFAGAIVRRRFYRAGWLDGSRRHQWSDA